MARSVEYCGGTSIPLPVCLCLQKGFTAILAAALYGHLTVLRTLVEQYGGNVLHRKKVKCYMMSDYSPLLDVGSLQYNNLCCEYFIVYFFTSCMHRYIVHDVFQVCLCAYNCQVQWNHSNGHHWDPAVCPV